MNFAQVDYSYLSKIMNIEHSAIKMYIKPLSYSLKLYTSFPLGRLYVKWHTVDVSLAHARTVAEFVSQFPGRLLLLRSLPKHSSAFHFQRLLPFITGQGVRVGLEPLLPLLMAGSTVLHGPLYSLRSPRSYPQLSTMDPDFIMGAWLFLGLPTEASFLLLCYATLGLCVWDQLIARSGPSICQGWEL